MSNICLTPYFNKATGLYCRCGKCENCKRVKRNDWSFRMDRELKYNKDIKFSSFVTLTYKDDDLIIWDDNSIRRKYKFKDRLQYAVLYPYHWSKFLRELQKNSKLLCGKLVRYYALLEYGNVEQRPHIHIILFSPMDEENTKYFVRLSWDKISKGSIIDYQEITFADITYCAKHNLKECGGNKFQNKVSPSVTRCSKKNGGIGIDFFRQSMDARDNYYYLNNFKVSTPEFYRKKRKAFDNLMQFDSTVKKMILSDAVLLNRILNMPCMQKYETPQRNVIRRVAQFMQDSLTKEIGRKYGYQYPDYSSHVLPILRAENRRLRLQRFNQVRTRTLLKIKHLSYISKI